ncbi:MAG: DUF2116 family Zn-ribbon domain-containing protein [Candidatus Marinarcus sp.]|uniref:hypothetical protein n=1 Tax=Candidatus Marinarcus sp. TaxID=3100987 RepID=UPI003B00942A
MSNLCQYCSKKIPINKVFCSNTCKENYFQMLAINLPKPFLKRLYFFCNKEQKQLEIKKFAQRHRWDETLVAEKAEQLIRQYFL